MTGVTLELRGEWNDAQHNAAHAAVDVIRRALSDQTAEGFLSLVSVSQFAPTRFEHDDGTFGQLDATSIANLIRTGKEWGEPADGVIALQVRLEPRMCNWVSCVMGYVVRPAPLITTNSRWLNGQLRGNEDVVDAVSIAAHWMHEWMHVAGFEHGASAKHQDVPYRIGSLFAETAKKMMEQAGEALTGAAWGEAYLEAAGTQLKAPDEDSTGT